MTLIDHLEELRRRLIHSLIALVVSFLICWFFASQLFAFLARPIYRYLPKGTRLAFLGLSDPFILYIKVAAIAAVFLAWPYVIYQLYAFVAPGLYRRERRWALPFVFLGTLFFAAGGAFAYTVVFPFAVRFFLKLGGPFEPVITVQKYFGFLTTMMLSLGLMFELPILIFLLSAMGLVTPRFLLRHFRWAILAAFIVGAIMTPPDVASQVLFAVPTIGLYLLGVAAAALAPRLIHGRPKEEGDQISRSPAASE